MSDESSEKPEHLEEIRDIIFGPQKREFERRVSQIQNQIAAMQVQFTQAVDALSRTLADEVHRISRSLDDKVKLLEERDSADRLELIQQAQQLEQRFTSSLGAAVQSAAERFASLDLLLKKSEADFTRELQSHDERRESDKTELLEHMRQARDDFNGLLVKAQQSADEHNASFARHLTMAEERRASDRVDLLRQLDQLETRFDKSVQNAIQTAAEKIGALDVQLKAMYKKNEQGLSDLRAEFMQNLEQRTNELTHSKVSREVMAEVLTELAKRVRGEERTDLKLISQTKSKTP